MTRPRLLITGGTGFVGSAMAARAASEAAFDVCASVRRLPAQSPPGVRSILVGDLDGRTDWRPALSGIDVVIHTAARVHVMRDAVKDPLAEFRRSNVAGTLNLARQAAAAGARRFVFISSIKVNGEETHGRPYMPDDAVSPRDSYGISKHEAEQGLRHLARETGIEVSVIRPVLVYGPGVKANFLSMMRWLNRGLPLPLGAINNRRSLVALENLVDLTLLCVHHPAAANQTFLVSDGEDLSTSALLRRLGAALGRPAKLLPVPPAILRGAARVVGQEAAAHRLCASLQVDISKTRQLLGWAPPLPVDAALRRTAERFLAGA